MGVGATGPLSSPLFPDAAAGPRPPAGTGPLAQPVPGAAPVQNAWPAFMAQTGTYAQASLSPVGFTLPAQPAQLVQHAMQNFDGLDPAEKAQLNQLASDLGFASGRTLAHALRHLPPESCQAWLKSLPTGARQPEQVRAAREGLTQLARTAVNQFFAAQKLPQPTLLPPASDPQSKELWDASSYLAVFNSMSELKASLPEDTFKKLAAPDGNPIEFERKHQPPATTGGVMQTLTGCMCIAHSNGLNRISLYDPAVSMNPKDILQREDIQGLLHRLNQTPPPAEDVKSLQEMLNLGMPPNRKLPVDGQMNEAVKNRLRDFESIQVLKQSLDIVRDDPHLSDKDKADFSQRIKGLIGNVQNSGTDPQSLNQLLSDLGKLKGLAPASSERLADLNKSRTQGNSSKLQPQQLELLVRNWFGMIDSGAQYDFTEQVINHEVGHLLQGQNELLKNWSQISFRDPALAKAAAPQSEFMSETLKSRTSGWAVAAFEKVGLNFSNGFGSDYAQVNPQEDFAESFRLFTRNPEQLAKDNPLKFVIMAGATGKYAGKERELVNFLKKQGYSDLNLQNMVRIMRGQNTAFVTQQTQSIVSRGLNWLETAAEVVMPSLMAPKLFGKDPIGDSSKAIANKLAGVAGKISDDNTPRFDMSISTMLPGLEGALGMQTQIHRVLPNQPGYVLDWLTDQCARLQSPDPQTREAASKTLDTFAHKGLDALAPDIRRQLPAAEVQRLSKPAERSMMLVLAHVHAMPEKLQVWSDRIQAAGQKLSDLAQAQLEKQATRKATQDRKELETGLTETKLESLLGQDLVKALPKSFKALLREPGMLEKISGVFGRIDLDSGQIQQEVEEQVSSRTEALQRASRDLFDPQNSNLITNLADGCFQPDSRNHKKLVVDDFNGEMALASLQQLFQDIASSSTQSTIQYTQALGKEILNSMARRLSSMNASQQDLSSSNPAYKAEVAQALLSELSARHLVSETTREIL